MPRAIAFDFKEKIDTEIPMDKVRPAIAGGQFVWLDIEGTDPAVLRDELKRAVPLDEGVIDACLTAGSELRYNNRPSCLHLVLVGCRLFGHELMADRVDMIVGEGYCVTVHGDAVPFLEKVKAHYHDDFVQFAKSPGFLLYEVFDALIDGWEDVGGCLDEEVDEMQHRIFTSADESALGEFGGLQNALLQFRRVLAPARNVLDELSTRKSRFVPEATQPFLGGMVPRVERILQEVMVNREILSDALTLHVAVGDHRLNRIIEKLTMVTMFFLPLTFLTGVYGMNFDPPQPDLRWQFGWAWFWGLAIVFVTTVYILLRRAKLI